MYVLLVLWQDPMDELLSFVTYLGGDFSTHVRLRVDVGGASEDRDVLKERGAYLLDEYPSAIGYRVVPTTVY